MLRLLDTHDYTECFLSAGPYGINHGVEQHIDVVEYARERLEHFKKTCEAFDEFEFCEPQSVVSNLQISFIHRLLLLDINNCFICTTNFKNNFQEQMQKRKWPNWGSPISPHLLSKNKCRSGLSGLVVQNDPLLIVCVMKCIP